MQELKTQNGLLLQLVKGLQNQINSKNRENHILFQQYEQLASDNSDLRQQIDGLKLKQREHTLDNQMSSPRYQQNVQLKQKINSLEEQIRGLTIRLEQKGGFVIFLQSQLHEARFKLASYEQSQNQDSKTDAIVRIPDQSRSVEDAHILNELTSKIQSLESAILEKQVLLDSLGRQNAELKQKIVSFKNQQQRYRQNIENLTSKINEQKLILASKEQSLTDLGQFLSSLTAKTQESVEKQADLQNNLQQALKRMINMEQDREKLKSQVVELREQKQKRQSDEAKLSDVTGPIEIEVDEIHVRLSTKEDQLLRANQVIIEKERTITECFERISQLQGQILQQIITKDKTILQLTENLNEKLQKITQLRQKVQQLEENKQTYSKDYQQNKLRETLKTADLQNQLKNKEEALLDMNACVQENNLKLTKLEESYKILLSKNQLKQRSKKESGDLQHHKAKVKELQEIIAAKDVVIGQFTELIRERNLMVVSMEQQKMRLVAWERNKYENINNDINANVQILQGSLVVKDLQISALNAKNSQHQANIQEMQAKIVQLKLKCSQANSMPPQKVKQLQDILAIQGLLIVNLTQKVQHLEAREVEMQMQLEAAEEKYKARDDEVEKEQKNARNSIEKIQQLNQSILQLEDIIKTKSQTIAQLTEYMNEQALRIIDLEAQVQNKLPVDVINDTLKITQLENLLKIKQECVTELREYLQQNAVKNIELQKRILQLQTQNLDQKQTMKVQQIQVVGSAVRVDYLAQIQNLIKQRKLDLEYLELECLKQQQNRQNVRINQQNIQMNRQNMEINQQNMQMNRQNIEVSQQNIQMNRQTMQMNRLTIQMNRQTIQREAFNMDSLNLDKKNLQFQIEGIKDNLKELLRQKQEMQIVLRKMSSQIESLQNKKSESLEVNAVDKEQEINALTELLQKLIEQVKDKKEMICFFQDKCSQIKNSEFTDTQENKLNVQLYENKIVQLEKQVENLKAHHQKLTLKLQTIKKIKLLMGKCDAEMPKQLQLESKISKDSYRKQLHQLSQAQQQSAEKYLNQKQLERAEQIQRNEQSLKRVEQQQKALNAGQLLSQILIYSQDATNSNRLQKLIRTLTERYTADFEQYQFQNKKLRAEVDNYAAQQLIYENKINKLNEQIQQLNLFQQLNEKNEIIESLHDLNGQKEKSFSEKIEELRSSFQVNTDEFYLNFSGKQSKQVFAEPITEQIAKQQFQTLKKENADLQQSVKEIREELEILIVDNQNKAAQIKSLKKIRKQPTMEKEFVDLLRDSDSNINVDGIEHREIIEKLKAQRDAIKSKCITLQVKVKELQKERQRQQQTIQAIQKQFIQQKNQTIKHSEQSQPKSKVLSQFYAKKQTQRMQSQSQRSEDKEQVLAQKIMEKNQIIAELEETVLKLQKGYNHEIMQLRRNNAELNGQIINLSKKLYILAPNSIDVADFVKETCRQAVSETQFYKSRYNLKYASHYSQVEQPHNTSYLTEQSRSKRYQLFFNNKELTLGEKIIGRRCRGDPLNCSINNHYRLSPSAWQMQGPRPL